MKYYPKNRIKTGLYTNGDEYIAIDTNQLYIGKYWSTSEGKFFTGLGPTNTPYVELILKGDEEIDEVYEIGNPLVLKKSLYEQIENDIYDEEIIISYLKLRGEEIRDFRNNDPTPIYLPTPFYPQPSKDDYELGEFQRYFCVKTNELKYTEISKEQCLKFKNKDDSVAWQYYIPFAYAWQISGVKEKCYITNKNMTLLTEKRNERRGLQEFLKKNYLKFYEEDKQPKTSSISKPKTSKRTPLY